ncbi:MAG: porin [Bradyrhizobium sp.]|uniref:porin n=1 Tax=Bradyrhizobium sp. TaxID=376 RepID=UPI003D0C2C7A
MKTISRTVAATVALLGWTGAQAQSSVTIYGLLDAALTTYSASAGTALPGGAGARVAGRRAVQLDSGVGPGGSRIGFRGVEDLGGGLQAKFLLEGGPSVDNGSFQQGGLPFGRQVYVGIGSGTSWSVTAGRQYSPMNSAFALSTPTYGFYWGNAQTSSGYGIWDSVVEGPGSGLYQATARMDNSILFATSAGKLSAELMVAAGNENARKTGRLINPGIAYLDGPLAIRASYARFKQGAASITPSARPEWLTQYAIGGSYNFGVAHVFAGVFGFEGPQNPANLNAAATLGSPTANPFAFAWRKQRTTWIGARVPVGGGTLLTSIGQNRFDYATGPDGKTMAYLLAYEYPLSRRTTLYGSLGSVRNNAFANTPLVATVVAVPASGFNSDVRATSIGIRHTF